MTPSDTRGVRGRPPGSVQSGAMRASREALDEAPRGCRVSWARTVEPFPT